MLVIQCCARLTPSGHHRGDAPEVTVAQPGAAGVARGPGLGENSRKCLLPRGAQGWCCMVLHGPHVCQTALPTTHHPPPRALLMLLLSCPRWCLGWFSRAAAGDPGTRARPPPFHPRRAVPCGALTAIRREAPATLRFGDGITRPRRHHPR